MHPTILAKRKAEAVAKLVFAAEALAETLELDSALIAGLHPIGTHDNQLREMMLLEGAANLIQAVAIQSGAIMEGVSMETAEPTVHWVETSETQPEAQAADEVSLDESPEEIAQAESEFLKPDATEEVTVQEEQPEAVFFEEEPAPEKPKVSKKSTGRRAKK